MTPMLSLNGQRGRWKLGRIHDVLKTLGIRRTYKGYYYVADAVHLVMNDPSMLLYISKSLYPEIARRHDTTINSAGTVSMLRRWKLWQEFHCIENQQPANSLTYCQVICYLSVNIKKKVFFWEGRKYFLLFLWY